MGMDSGTLAICTYPGRFPDADPASSTAHLTAGFPGEEFEGVGPSSHAKSALENHSSLDVHAHVYRHLKFPSLRCPGAEDVAGIRWNPVVAALWNLFRPPPAAIVN